MLEAIALLLCLESIAAAVSIYGSLVTGEYFWSCLRRDHIEFAVVALFGAGIACLIP